MAASKDTPQLHWFHFGAQHSPQTPWDKMDSWEETYRRQHQKASNQLEVTVDTILEHDPTPLIIAIGDHGAYRYRYVYNGPDGDPNQTMRSRGFEPELIAKDICSVFLGIRWPVPHYSKGEILSHVRIFPHVIAALTEDKSHLENMMPNVSLFTSHQIKNGVTMVRDGIPLKDWEPISPEKELLFLEDRVKQNPKNVEMHLGLVSGYYKAGQDQKGFDYLISLTKLFPESEAVHIRLAEIYIEQKDIPQAQKHALAAMEINHESGLAYYWLGIIAEMAGQRDKCDHFISKAYECGGNLTIKKDLHLRYAYILMKRGNYGEASKVIGQLDRQHSILFSAIIDWQMQFAAFLEGNNPQLFNWLDTHFEEVSDRHMKLESLERKLVVSMMAQEWNKAEETARKVLEFDDNHMGAHVTLSRSIEMQGRVPEALQTCAESLNKTQSSTILEQLGFMAIRNNIHHPDLARIKALAREQLASRKTLWARMTSFDEKWYVKKYGPLPKGISPLEHYMQNSLALMLNPNSEFDTTYYYSNNTDVFRHGVDAAVHYTQFGQHEDFRPRLTCFMDHSVTPNVNWRSGATG